MDLHRLAEERSRAYHAVVVDRLRADPTVLDRARTRVSLWLAGGVAPFYARQWQEILAGTVDDVCRLLLADGEEARALRQATPFAGVLTPRERWGLWARTRERLSRAP